MLTGMAFHLIRRGGRLLRTACRIRFLRHFSGNVSISGVRKNFRWKLRIGVSERREP
jgi:hypothetical protein